MQSSSNMTISERMHPLRRVLKYVNCLKPSSYVAVQCGRMPTFLDSDANAYL